ncbi:O-antigen ligase family protein [Carboxydothermus hydrogenoformans]|uniref:O-antigen ligase family protein n=1 Tax=Carboxydothermus hydrogenoformans TaxID=129958 RepID=UPI00059EDDA5|nr:O-antigen ligase family protein [Carboxydothermus hydrogenoformans]
MDGERTFKFKIPYLDEAKLIHSKESIGTLKFKIPYLDEVKPYKTMWFILLLGFSLLFLLPPFYRGLFFEYEQEVATLWAIILVWLVYTLELGEKKPKFLQLTLDYAVLALPIIYLISIINAANIGFAVDEFVQNILYFLVFWLATRFGADQNARRVLLHAVYLAAIGVSLAGLMTATGVINIRDGYLSGRIYSSFQYPNALASYLAAAFLIGIYLWVSSNKALRYFYGIGNYIILTVLLGTKSNGGLMVFLAIMVLYFIFQPPGKRFAIFFHLFLNLALAFVVIKSFIYHVDVTGQTGNSWLWFLVGLIIAIMIEVIIQFIVLNKAVITIFTKYKKPLIYMFLGFMVVALIGGLILVLSNEVLREKIYELLRIRNASERGYFYRDALKMFFKSPLIGWGGGGWGEAYRAFQSYFYISTQVHSYYLQLFVETGVLGVATIVTIIGSFFKYFINLWRKTSDYWLSFEVVTLGAVIINIAGHAAIDFDLSLAALSLVLFLALGFIRTLYFTAISKPLPEKNKRKVQFNSIPYFTLISVIAIGLLIFVGMLATASHYEYSAYSYYQAQDLQGLKNVMENAARYNPFNASYNEKLRDIYKSFGDLNNALLQAEKAVAKSKYDPYKKIELSYLYYQTGQIDKAADLTDKFISDAPFMAVVYDAAARVNMMCGLAAVRNGDLTKAREYFNKVVKVRDLEEKQITKYTPETRKLQVVAPVLSVTPEVKLNVGIAYYFLKDFAKARENLLVSKEKTDLAAESLLWLTVLESKAGNTELAGKYKKELEKAPGGGQLVNKIGEFLSLPLL